MRIFKTPPETPVRALLGVLDRALAGLETLEPNRFRRSIVAEPTLAGQYLAICHLGYAANSKELRDTSDRRVHAALDRLANAITALDVILRIRLFPADADQDRAWRTLCSDMSSGHLLPRRDGSLECLLLTATRPAEASLHVTRIWNDTCNFDGTRVDMTLPLDRSQSVNLGQRLDILRDEPPYQF